MFDCLLVGWHVGLIWVGWLVGFGGWLVGCGLVWFGLALFIVCLFVCVCLLVCLFVCLFFSCMVLISRLKATDSLKRSEQEANKQRR